MRSSLTFNGVSSEELNLFIERVPNQNRPARKMDVYSVPGRNGDIVIMQDAWENVEQSYEIWGGWNEIGRATRVGYSLSDWLFSANGYQRLEDTYDQDHYRLAYFAGPFDFENILRRRGRATITFSCDPRRFLKIGEYPVNLPIGVQVSLYNPTNYPAKPYINVNPNGDTSGTIIKTNGYYSTQFITWSHTTTTGPFVLDCEREAATWAVGGVSKWIGDISGVYLTLEKGENILEPSGTNAITTITPNWWEL